MNIRYIEYKQRSYLPFSTYKNRNILMSRRSGKTTMLKKMIVKYHKRNNNYNIIVIVPILNYAKEYLDLEFPITILHRYSLIIEIGKDLTENTYVFSDEMLNLDYYLEMLHHTQYIQGYYTL